MRKFYLLVLLIVFGCPLLAQECDTDFGAPFMPIRIKEFVIKAGGEAEAKLENKDKLTGFLDIFPDLFSFTLKATYEEEFISGLKATKINACSCSLYNELYGAAKAEAVGVSPKNRVVIYAQYQSQYGKRYRQECLGLGSPRPEKGVKPHQPNVITAPPPRTPPVHKRKPRRACNGAATVKMEGGYLVVDYPCDTPRGISGEYWFTTSGHSFSNWMVQYLPELTTRRPNRIPWGAHKLPPDAKDLEVRIYQNPAHRTGHRRLIGRLLLHYAR